LYESPYIKDIQIFKDEIIHKRVIPHQVEIQPGALGARICWLECPYCYGKSAINSPDRLSLERYIQVMKDIMDGGCNKIIFAGWATDPLYYKDINDLVQTVVERNAVIGFNTRAIYLSERLVELVSRSTLAENSYMSISVNAGNNENYNKVNGARSNKAKLYDRVVENVRRIVMQKRKNNAPLDISISYLINQYTSSKEEVMKFIADFKGVGADLIRFSCPQIPRGDVAGENSFIPTPEEYNRYIKELTELIEEANDDECRVIIINNDDKFLIARTTPCFARFIYPTIGYDGWLYHCSQSSGSNFRSQALGNLATDNFWDLLYDYEANDLDSYFSGCTQKMESNNCRCDRKEHTVNTMINGNNFFKNQVIGKSKEIKGAG
jgi:MoaA/NifB/PqqE/SkfB family radical SAM enzyme